MKSSENTLNRKWVSELYTLLSTDPDIIFGPKDPILKMGSLKSFKRILTNTKRFQKNLKNLCTRFGIDIANPYHIMEYPYGGKFKVLKSSRLNSDLSIQLLHLLDATNSHLSASEKNLTRIKKATQESKPGPTRINIKFAELMLVGLQVHRTSRQLNFLRKFIEPNGELDIWIKANTPWNRDTFITATAYEDPSDWFSKKRQIWERIVLSDRVGKPVKSYNSYTSEVRALKIQILDRAKKYN